MELPDSKYKAFYKQKSQKVWKVTPLVNHKVKVELECDMTEHLETIEGHFLQRSVGLPDGRIFVIGGASDVRCSKTVKDCYELVATEVNGKVVRKREPRAQMW